MATEENTPEQWRAVVGYEGFYEVSNLGRVRSIRSGTALILRAATNGYVAACINVHGHKEKLLVHRLVLSAFVRPPKPGEVCNHLDFDKTNNRPDNLEWTTPRGNSAHAKAAGRMNTPLGERHGMAQLTDDDVRCIRRLCASGSSRYSVARLFSISEGHVGLIVVRKRWAHVD